MSIRWVFLLWACATGCTHSVDEAGSDASAAAERPSDLAMSPDLGATVNDASAPSDLSFAACCTAGVTWFDDGGYAFPPVYNYCTDQNQHSSAGTIAAGGDCTGTTDCVGGWFGTDAGTIAFFLTACDNGKCITPVEACQLNRCNRPSSNCTELHP